MLVVIQAFAQEKDMTLLNILLSNFVATNDFHTWLVPAAAVDKLHLNFTSLTLVKKLIWQIKSLYETPDFTL